MKVLIAEHAGFCFGVEKAIEKVQEEIESRIKDEPVYSLGPIIHNHQVVALLEEKGLRIIDEIDEAEDGTVIIRSHGVPEATYRELESRGLRVVDTTCPFVKKIQRIVSDHHAKGYRIIIIGNRNHPEVVGINGWCDNQGHIVGDPLDLELVPKRTPLCVVAQTTMPVALFQSVVAQLSKRDQEIRWYNTICLATQDRQQKAKELAQKVDAMVVIGGSHSSNTKKLEEVCRKYLPDTTFSIETIKDLPLGRLSQIKTIGITSGASTPGEAIKEAAELLGLIEEDVQWQIAIDGPAGAGKSTIAKYLAKRLAFTYVDTGAMYRAFTWYLTKKKCSLTNIQEITKLTQNLRIDLTCNSVFLNQEDATEAIRSLEVTQNVSKVASIKEVRAAMVSLQQDLAKKHHVVMDGRDIGTVVLPKATLKVFLTASVEERAKRRYEEIKDHTSVTYEEIRQQIEDRDHSDETREHDPLIPAEDAVQIDSTSLSIEEVVEEIIRRFCKKIKELNEKYI